MHHETTKQTVFTWIEAFFAFGILRSVALFGQGLHRLLLLFLPLEHRRPCCCCTKEGELVSSFGRKPGVCIIGPFFPLQRIDFGIAVLDFIGLYAVSGLNVVLL